MKLNIGCGHNKLPVTEGWLNLDCSPEVLPECLFDLGTIELGEKLPFSDDSFSELYMSHVLEHLPHPLPIMEEFWRVAAPGAKLQIHVPYGSSDIAFEDPTHYRQYFMNSFMYFGQPAYARADYGYRGDWQETLRVLVLANELDRKAIAQLGPAGVSSLVKAERNIVEEFIVTLIAVKPIRPAGSPADKVSITFAWPEQVRRPGAAT